MKQLNWSPDSWRTKVKHQLPHYEDEKKLIEVEKTLQDSPPLVFSTEIKRLKSLLAQVGEGKLFLLQGGDCAESFKDFNSDSIKNNLLLFLELAKIIGECEKKSILKVGRVAGQFAKPRSKKFETRDHLTLPAYQGDMINDHSFCAHLRTANPQRMIQAYHQSAATINLLRSFCLENRTIQDGGIQNPLIKSTEFFTSHEALLLPYEEALTRTESDSSPDEKKLASDWYDFSAHMLWVGERTRQLDGAHVEFMRGINNPIGLKCGPLMEADELIRLIDILNPLNVAGRLTLITRMGVNSIEEKLPPLIERIQEEGRNVVWCCDPMHGNTFLTKNGFKTRSLASISEELKKFFSIHKTLGTIAGGVHIEFVAKQVTECVGFEEMMTADSFFGGDLYETLCDPRLNTSQALELALAFSKRLDR